MIFKNNTIEPKLDIPPNQISKKSHKDIHQYVTPNKQVSHKDIRQFTVFCLGDLSRPFYAKLFCVKMLYF